MIFAPCPPDPELVNQIVAEIRRLKDAQQMMQDANAAVIAADEKTLVMMGFETDHIDELLKRNESGKPAFPAYALRNNQEAITHLESLLEQARRGRFI
ncbi:hypothetical protein [Pseudomonas siliginis]|uniref:hypothetical protein n=1 Tax=Pseudomonas siliginis TaxID=2842346 RepID=UPI00209322FE|nr:hypothetical protein [Pseudomonas siliginis]UST77262.1 hypothetical protein NF676_00335 [Pseudomonas siliginis]